jgi:hypothetical protein
MPQVMELDRPYAAGSADAVERADEVAGSTGRPILVVKTSPLSCQARSSSSRSAACASWRMPNTSTARGSIGRSRLPALVLTGPTRSSPLTRPICWRTRISPPPRSTSVQRRPRIRSPVL